MSIHAVERFLGDLAVEQGWKVPAGKPTGKKVLVVGAGPGGLSCAWHLRLMGHEVEIRDAEAEPGGMMHYGIPAYRLPRAELLREIRRIEDDGRAHGDEHARRRRRRRDDSPAGSTPASSPSAPMTATTSTSPPPTASR